jgi:hypothetical protein
MYIPPYRKGKTTFRQHTRLSPAILFLFVVAVLICCVFIIIIVRILQSARCQDGFLTLIESDGAEFFPVRYQRVFGHDFVESEFTLCVDVALAMMLQREGKGGEETYVSKFFHRHANQLSHFLVSPEDFSSASPTTCWNSHTGEYAIVFHQGTLPPHFNSNKLDISQQMHGLPELWPKLLELTQYLLSQRRSHVRLHIRV